MPTSTYQYIPLPERSIRIIIIEPSRDKAAPLRGRFEITSVDKPRRYFALSYTWNGESPSRPLEIAGKQILITPNAEAALRRMRGKWRPLAAWVDAICINQPDVQERNSQVTMMFDIYKKAAEVRVWLGPNSTDNIHVAMRRLYWLQPLARLPVRIAWLIDTILGDYNGPLGGAKTKVINGMRQLREKAYWTRVWTIQEYVANRSCRIFCGSEAPIRSLVLEQFDLGKRLLLEDVSALGPRVVSNGFPGSNPTGLHFAAQKSILAEKPWMLNLESLLRGKAASEPRDYVFALCQIFNELLGPLQVDYDMTEGEVFRRATANLIRNSSSARTRHRYRLQLLDILDFSCRPSNVLDLPSWAIDWSQQQNPDPLFVSGSRRRWPKNGVKFSEDDLRMRIQGKLLLTLEEPLSDTIPNMPPSDLSSHTDRWREFCREFLSVSFHFILRGIQLRGLEVFKLFRCSSIWEELEKNFASFSDLASWFRENIDYELLLEECLRIANNIPDPERNLPAMIDHLRHHFCNRRIFFDRDKGLGLCGPRSEVGDYIVLFRGSSTAFVVRKAGNQYILIERATIIGYEDETLENDDGVEELEFI